MFVQILIDNVNSWVLPFGRALKDAILARGKKCVIIHDHERILEGDVLVLLSCEQILKKKELNRYNLVIHASDLPKGRGWSPLTWQILEGKNEIPLTLFEAADKVDAGVVYLKDKVVFEGHELIGELRDKMALKCNEMILDFIDNQAEIKGQEQVGEPTFYKKRSPEDSRLNIDLPIKDQFDLFRISDNERYPVYFEHRGHKYILKIYKSDE